MSNEIVDTVARLNDVFFHEDVPMDFAGFEYRGNGYSNAVSFMGVRIWSDDDDGRVFNEQRNEYEPYFDCFKREAVRVLVLLSPIRDRLLSHTPGPKEQS